jgi:hypothetical protein
MGLFIDARVRNENTNLNIFHFILFFIFSYMLEVFIVEYSLIPE